MLHWNGLLETKKMVVSEIPYEYKEIIYKLGKHHREPLSGSSCPFILPKARFMIFQFLNGQVAIKKLAL